MTIITSNFIVNGTISNFPALYANNITASDFSNIKIHGGVDVYGDVYAKGRLDFSDTIFVTLLLSSNVQFSGSHELVVKNNQFNVDITQTDLSASSNVPMVIPPPLAYNHTTGIITIPASGLYNFSVQGSFSNDVNATNVHNGVYWRFLNHSHSNARIAPNMTAGDLISTSTARYLLAGDLVQAVFYSSDSNATLIGNTGETLLSFSLVATITPSHSNYFRV